MNIAKFTIIILLEPGAIRAASQSLASVALAQSKEEAMNILRPSPKKEDRPDINLCDKIKTTASIQVSNSPVRSLIHDEKLPSRKLVERDESLRAKKSEAQVPSPKPKLPTRKLGESDMKSPKTEQKTRKENPTKESNKQAVTPTATKRKSSVTPTSSERGGASVCLYFSSTVNLKQHQFIHFQIIC